MLTISHYFLPVLSLLLIVIWLWIWKRYGSARNHQWLILTAVASLPMGIAVVLWWIWPLEQLSFAPQAWSSILFIIAFSLYFSVISFISRLTVTQQFSQPISFNWLKYSTLLITFFIVRLIEPSLSLSPSWLFAIYIWIVIITIIAISKSRQQLKAVLAAILISGVILIVLGTVASLLDPHVVGFKIMSWRLAWTLDHLIAILSLFASSSLVASLWLNQPVKQIKSV